jgi:hypothetical protein
VNGVIEALLLLGLAAGPDDPSVPPSDTVHSEALADLTRRVGTDAVSEEKKPQQEDPKPQRPDAPLAPPQEEASPPFVDFDWMELHVRVGMSKFSKDFHIKPSPAFAIEARAPITFLAPSSNPEGDYFGVFAQISFTTLKRDIQPQVDKPSGAMLALAVGVDYTILRDSTWMLLAHAGVVYATYGGVTDLKDGIGPMVGLEGGITISRSVHIVLAPEFIMGGSGSNMMMATIGVAIDF